MLRFLSCYLIATGSLLAPFGASAQTYLPNWESLDTRPVPAWFTDAKFGIFIHWGLYSVPAYAPVGIPNEQPYAEWYWNSMAVGKERLRPNITEGWKFHERVYGADFPYESFAPQFKAELFDPDAWASLFQRSGAKYVVLTSKHHDGFALWPSKEASRDFGHSWNSIEIGPHRDLVGDLSAAVRAKGLKMGLYYSLYEWNNPLWLADKPKYVSHHMMPQFKDLVTRYKPSIIFADGEWELSSSEWKSPELLAWLFDNAPVRDEVVINDRWGKETRHKHGGYWTTEYTAGMTQVDHAWEESRGMGSSYGYNRAEKLSNYHSGRELVLMLIDTVSRGGNLLLDIGPAADGSIPVIMEERLTQIGSWLSVNGDAIYGTHRLPQPRQYGPGKLPTTIFNQEFMVPYEVTHLVDGPGEGNAAIEAFFTAKGNRRYAILPSWQTGTFTLRVHGSIKIGSVKLLGSVRPISFKQSGETITLHLPELPANLRSQPAWTLSLEP
jgi:alpha-L-fucosidase